MSYTHRSVAASYSDGRAARSQPEPWALVFTELPSPGLPVPDAFESVMRRGYRPGRVPWRGWLVGRQGGGSAGGRVGHYEDVCDHLDARPGGRWLLRRSGFVDCAALGEPRWRGRGDQPPAQIADIGGKHRHVRPPLGRDHRHVRAAAGDLRAGLDAAGPHPRRSGMCRDADQMHRPSSRSAI